MEKMGDYIVVTVVGSNKEIKISGSLAATLKLVEQQTISNEEYIFIDEKYTLSDNYVYTTYEK